MTSIIKLETPEIKEIEASKAEMIRKTFEPMVEMLQGFESIFEEIAEEAKKEITEELTKKAKRTRLDIAKIRVTTEKTRKAQKEEYLRAGKAIDGVANIIKWAVVDKEEKLEAIEKHFELIEKQRKEKLQRQRVMEVSAYIADAEERNFSDMEEDVWKAFLNMKKSEYEERKKAEKKAEEERMAKEKAEAEERKKIAQENERLKKEAEEARKKHDAEMKRKAEEEAQIKAEYEKKIEEERKAREIAEKQEFEKRRKEAEEIRKKHELEMKKKAEEEAKLRAELKAREEEARKKHELEMKKKAEEEAKIQAKLSADDVEKIEYLKKDLAELKTKYSFKSEKNIQIYSKVGLLLDKVVSFITEQ
jgi:hypothetical protein